MAYIVLGITVLLVLAFSIIGIFKGNLKKTLISIGLFVLVVAISYFGLSGEFGTQYNVSDTEKLSASGARWIGTGLWTFYILALAAVGSMLVSTAKKAINS